MIAESIMGFIGGVATSVIGPAMEMWKLKVELKHKEKMYDKEAPDKEHERLVQHSTAMTQLPWYDPRALVRPVISLWVMWLYSYLAVIGKVNIVDTVPVVFAMIVGFYFGNRAQEKWRNTLQGR